MWVSLRRTGKILPSGVLQAVLPRRRRGTAVDVIKLLNGLDISLEALSAGDPRGDVSVDLEGEAASVRVALGQGRERGRMQISRAIGLVMLGSSGIHSLRSSEPEGPENEVWDYARALLMPRSEVRVSLEAALSRLTFLEVSAELARRYGVPAFVAQSRLAQVMRGSGRF